MRERLFIQYRGEEPLQCQVMNGNGEPAAGVYRGGLADIHPFTQGRQVVVLIPARELLCFRPSVPKASAAKLRQAVPYLVEDYLLGTPESYHFALGNRDEQGRLPLHTLPRAELETLLAPLEAAAITPAVMMADLFGLPWQPGQCSLYLEAAGVRVRSGEYEGFYSEWENLPLLLQGLMQAEQPPTQLNLYGSAELLASPQTQALREALASYETLAWSEQQAELLQLCCRNFRSDRVINLLQGEFRRKPKLDRHIGPWRMAAGLLLGWLLFLLLAYGVGYWQLARELAWLDNHIEAEIRTGFPEIKTIRQPLNQVNSVMAQLRSQGGESQYQRLITAVGKAAQAQAVTLQELNYRNQRMTVSLQVADLQEVNRYEQALRENKGLSVKVLSAKKEAKVVAARIELSGEGK